MKRIKNIAENIKTNPETWLVTGAAGFIGSNLCEFLLEHNQKVIGLDNFSTGHQKNIDELLQNVGEQKAQNWRFIEGDICEYDTCQNALQGVDRVLHQAALGSVPRSLENPLASHDANITGFAYMLEASKQAGVKSFVYAASSSTYGDHPTLPKVEDKIGSPLSPYALTKYVNELYAEIYQRCYGFKATGLRYFNVFGRRQDPDGAYAAVIPKWIAAMIKDQEIFINGDGETSRDFCYIDNAVEANILASFADEAAAGEVYNVAYGARTSLNELYSFLLENLRSFDYQYTKAPEYRDFRAGDVRHSEADISKAASLLGYAPAFSAQDGLLKAMQWYVENTK